MNNLIVDAANDKILLKIIIDKQSYTSEYSNSRENFDNLSLIIFDFLKKKNTKIEHIANIFVNHGPGKYSGTRLSIVICKAICLAYDIKLYSYGSEQINGNNYGKILDLHKKGDLISDLIKPKYLN